MATKKLDLERELIRKLTEEGERIIKAAYTRRNWKNRTKNLKDSYGSAVYRNGVLLRNTKRFLTQNADANPYKNDKELGYYLGARSRAQRGSSYTEFGKSGDKRFLDGDTIYAYGRDEVNKFLEGYKPESNSGIELVVVAAMYYAGILESGYLGTKYQVISSATTDLNRIAQEIGKGVDVYALDIDRNKNEAFTSKAFTIRGKQKVN